MPDKWDSALYEDRHSFVWSASQDLVALLDAKPGERILDLGCGTGQLTAAIAETGADVIGLDSSLSMIASARQNYPKLKFVLDDARSFHFDRHFDAVFSNAALHWVHDADAAIRHVAESLAPGGRFLLEMGVKHNVHHIRVAIEHVLEEAGYPAVCPWYFPSPGEYCTILERYGLEVEWVRNYDRWSKLEHPERGLREWIEMFSGGYFEHIAVGEREGLIRKIEDCARPYLWRDGSWWADYRRLRIGARLTGR